MLAAILVSALLSLSPGARPGHAIRVPIDPPEASPPERHASSPTSTSVRSELAEISSVGNVRVNNPSLLPGPAADITPAIAVNGNQVLVVWYVRGATVTQRLRAAWSEDGGNSFTDAGWLPNIGSWRWGVDPSVEVDPLDGTFMVAAQVTDPGVPATGIGILTAHVSAGITWGAGSVTNATAYTGGLALDQFHSTFDATNRTWHLAFRDAYATSQALIHRYSADHGSTWFAPDTVVSNAGDYLGTYPRIAFMTNRGAMILHNNAPSGPAWNPLTIKSSTFSWPSFPPPVSLSTHRVDGGTTPGGVFGNHALAVDRTTHMFSSRAYAAWVQSATLAWPSPPAVGQSESEPNDSPGSANALGTWAGYLGGILSSNSDADMFSVSLAAGEHLVMTLVYLESLGIASISSVQIIAQDATHSLGVTGFLADDTGEIALFTAPRSGTYYVAIRGFQVGEYTYTLARSTEVASPARDRRELMTSYSGDIGDSWSTPVSIPMGTAGFDVGGPTIVVANDGRPYLFWIDFSKADPDGALATLEVTRSNNGGQTWELPRTISTVASDWQPVTVVSIANMKAGYRIDAASTPVLLYEPNAAIGDGQFSGTPPPSDDVHVAWVDARDGEGNIYSAHFPTGFDVLDAVTDTTVAPGQYLELRMVLRNRNSVFPELVTPSFVSLQRNWSHGYLNPFLVAEATTGVVYPFNIQVPDSAAAGTVFYQGAVLAGSEVVGGCNTVIHVQPTTDVDPRTPLTMAFDPPLPNPAQNGASFRFTLPSPLEVKLEIFDVTGARLRTLASERVAAGSHTRTWDLRDSGGHRVASGLYLSRLTAGGWSRTRRLVVAR